MQRPFNVRVRIEEALRQLCPDLSITGAGSMVVPPFEADIQLRDPDGKEFSITIKDRSIPAAPIPGELPLYRSHKQVRAIKIGSVHRHHDGSAQIFPAELGHKDFEVPAAYVAKHDPRAGGYYVTYEDGYASWSPAEAFESGYTRI